LFLIHIHFRSNEKYIHKTHQITQIVSHSLNKRLWNSMTLHEQLWPIHSIILSKLCLHVQLWPIRLWVFQAGVECLLSLHLYIEFWIRLEGSNLIVICLLFRICVCLIMLIWFCNGINRVTMKLVRFSSHNLSKKSNCVFVSIIFISDTTILLFSHNFSKYISHKYGMLCLILLFIISWFIFFLRQESCII
jgi:hypothetical protein